jgi:hypothetical protein
MTSTVKVVLLLFVIVSVAMETGALGWLLGDPLVHKRQGKRDEGLGNVINDNDGVDGKSLFTLPLRKIIDIDCEKACLNIPASQVHSTGQFYHFYMLTYFVFCSYSRQWQ